ncbi:hypothetical protein VCSRO206_2817 [Vibrio cholerae]|nr:hypothetical protein [Vibrio cholerae]GHX57865.1 hypothetical protein VCSRO206_2817 [Vibrio cholerae]
MKKKNISQSSYDKLAISLLSILSILYIYHFMQGGEFILGDMGDARLNNYFLEHGYQFLLGNHVSFWSAPFFYPEPHVITYSDNHLGTLPIYAFFRYLNYDIESSFQLWQISLFVLNAICAYVVLRKFNFNIYASFLGALFFTFCAPVLIKSGHIQLIPRFMVPFVFYSIVKFVETLNIKYFYLFSISLVLQFYIGIYIGFFCLIFLFTTLPVLLYFIYKNNGFHKVFGFGNLFAIFISTIISSVFLVVLFYPYIKFKASSGGRSWGEISTMLPRVESWFYTSGGFFDFFNTVGNDLPMRHEHQMFVGLIPIAIVIINGFLLKNKMLDKPTLKAFKFSVTIAFLSIVFTAPFILYVNGFSLYKLVFFNLPGFDAIRAVTRITLVIVFPIAILISFFIHFISRKKLEFFSGLFLLVFTLFFIGEQIRLDIPIYSKKEAKSRYFNLAHEIAGADDFDLIYYKYDDSTQLFYLYELDAMFLSLYLNKPVVNGYSGNKPNNYRFVEQGNLSSWFNYSGYCADNLRVLIYSGRGEGAKIEDIKCEDYKFTSLNQPLDDYSFSILSRPEYNDGILTLTIKNDSKVTWPSLYKGTYGVAFSYAINHDSNDLNYENRTLLPYDIAPEESVELSFNLNEIPLDVKEVCFNMVQDGVKWFFPQREYCYVLSL